MSEQEVTGQARRYCTSCGSRVGNGAVYCGSCGGRLATGADETGRSGPDHRTARGHELLRGHLQDVARSFRTVPIALRAAVVVLSALLILLVPAARGAAGVVLAVVIVVRWRQRRPARGWNIAGIVSLSAVLLGGILAPEPDLDLREPLEGPVLSYCTEADEPRGCPYYEYVVTSPLEDPESGEEFALALVEVYWLPSLVGAEEHRGVRKADIAEEVGEEYGEYDAVMVAYLSEPIGDRPSADPQDTEWVYNDPAVRPVVERMAGELGVPY